MRFMETTMPGLYLLEPKVFGDSRGFFLEGYNKKVFAENGFHIEFVQDNHARSEEKGVLRGLHFQLPPGTQAKLVRVTAGSVFDVAVDLRQGSPTYGKWEGFTLSADNKLQLLVPKGFAHGYLTLEPGTEFQYKVDDYYTPELDTGIRWNDPDIGVEWPVRDVILSDRDTKQPFLKDSPPPFVFEG